MTSRRYPWARRLKLTVSERFSAFLDRIAPDVHLGTPRLHFCDRLFRRLRGLNAWIHSSILAPAGLDRSKPRATPHGERGQSLILALTIMFLMVFVAGLFITLVARNIVRARRSGEVLSAQYLAEAGIRYADYQLTYSEDGADWRPVPTYPKVVTLLAEGETPQEIQATLSPPSDRSDERDPDHFWLIRGYSRYTYGKGRFLLRVTYDPRPDDPASRFIKIEAIGRMGIVDKNDPTTWRTRQPIRLREELVAYKPIGITDYAWFVTNKDRRSRAVSLGTPRFTSYFGENADQGAPIRVNGDLLWHGRNLVYLNPGRGDTVAVAGDIRHNVPGTDENATLVLVNDAPTLESTSSQFDTSPDDPGAEIGKYRDGRPEPDVSGRPRGITRLEPPVLDAVGAGSRLSRYRELTRNSGEWKLDRHGEWFNTGYYGWGDGIYIQNRRDVQVESVGYTLKGNWTQPGTEYWYGPYYVPPGVSVTLYPYDVDNADGDNLIDTGPDLVITRDERTRYIWRDKDGNPLPETGERIVMPYPANGIIFAEGNVRIKGMLPPHVRLTVVSGATIYVDGNILKYRDPNSGDVADDSAIALLATDYVCVNTTQFFGPLKEVPFPGPGAEFFDISPTSSFWFSFAFGIDPGDANQGYQGMPVALYVRHAAAQGGASYMNMLVNWPPTQNQLSGNPFYCFYRFNVENVDWVTNPAMEYIYPLGDVAAWPSKYAVQQYDSWEHGAFPVWPVTSGEYDVDLRPGVENRVGFQLDQSLMLPVAPQDYYLSRVAVQPMDIRIEGVLYAQNKSFFVIPGEWFNPDPADTDPRDHSQPRPPPVPRRLGIDDRWPFYGEPLDVRITVYGAVSENLPAPIGDVTAWMEKWGWIPEEHGSSSSPEYTEDYRGAPPDPDAQPNRLRGLTFIYDPLVSHPVVETSPNVFAALRADEYGRTLPVLPKLPVSPQLVYFGEPM